MMDTGPDTGRQCSCRSQIGTGYNTGSCADEVHTPPIAETGLIRSIQTASDYGNHGNADTGPGVIVGTILTAVLVKYTFPYGWNWVEVLLFGAMFSATDPVAVVAVLKEVILAASLQ